MRVLCWLGRHRWYRIRFNFGTWDECARCEKRRDPVW